MREEGCYYLSLFILSYHLTLIVLLATLSHLWHLVCPRPLLVRSCVAPERRKIFFESDFLILSPNCYHFIVPFVLSLAPYLSSPAAGEIMPGGDREEGSYYRRPFLSYLILLSFSYCRFYLWHLICSLRPLVRSCEAAGVWTGVALGVSPSCARLTVMCFNSINWMNNYRYLCRRREKCRRGFLFVSLE